MRLPSVRDLKIWTLAITLLAASLCIYVMIFFGCHQLRQYRIQKTDNWGLMWLKRALIWDASDRSTKVPSVTNFGPKNRTYLLVIFTTFKEGSDHHVFAHRLVVENWASFGSAVKTVLFTDQVPSNVSGIPNLAHAAMLNGWDIHEIPERNQNGTPHLRSMYYKVFETYEATFYGYCNGDLIFDDTLMKTLLHIRSILDQRLDDNVLLVGRRRDVEMRVPAEVLNGSAGSEIFSHQLASLLQRFCKENLSRGALNANLRSPDAIDFFFFSGNDTTTFRWNEIANVVIGRRAYDQYLIAMANRFGVYTIDMTQTALALHLSKSGVKDTGFQNFDSEYNAKIIGPFIYSHGTTDTTLLYTQPEAFTKKIFLVFRKPA